MTSSSVVALLALLAAPSLSAQGSLGATRQELEARAAQADAREAAAIRARLARGDFRVGDGILMVVEGEPTLSDTFTVGLGGQLTLPMIGRVPLEGVLRSELEEYLTRRLAQNLRDPQVQARVFVRLSIQGAVAHPGYYGVPADALLSEALMAAGGTTQEANVAKLRIERDGKPVWEGKALQKAIAEGRTLDAAGLVAGDQVIVPKRGGTTAGEVMRFGTVLLGIPITIYTLTKIF